MVKLSVWELLDIKLFRHLVRTITTVKSKEDSYSAYTLTI